MFSQITPRSWQNARATPSASQWCTETQIQETFSRPGTALGGFSWSTVSRSAGLSRLDFDTVNWPTSILENGPPPSSRSILPMRQEVRDGEESKGGAVRADPEGVRVRGRNHQGRSGEA